MSVGKTWMIVGLVPLALLAAACENDETGSVFGTFNLFVTIQIDGCGNDEGRFFSSQMVISGEPDSLIVNFGDQAVLTGEIDDRGFVVAQGPAIVPVTVGNDTVDVASTLDLQFGVRPSTSEASGRLTFAGTHPASPGVTCQQTFVASAQRASRAPIF